MTTFTLHYGDCLNVMKDLSANSIDLILCDLPYGCLSGRSIGKAAEDKKCWSGAEKGCSWDIPIDLEAFWKEVKRIRRNEHTPTIHFCTTKFGYELIKSNEKEFRYDLVWTKTNAVGFLSANKMPMRAHEMMYIFSKTGAYYKRKDIKVPGAKEWKQFGVPTSVESVYGLKRENPVVRPVGEITSKEGIRCIKSYVEFVNKKAKGGHPTAKSIELYKWLIERYCPEGGTVLDPTFGSCNSGRATETLNRNYIGIEKDETFYKKAVKSLIGEE